MQCLRCQAPDARVIDSRPAEEDRAIRRRRQCGACGHRFTTIETSVLTVLKRSGVTEEFQREKVARGIRRACQDRAVTEDQIARVALCVADELRSQGVSVITSDAIGLAVLPHLRQLDAVGYLRFASVYKAFDSVDDFQKELDDLRSHTTMPVLQEEQ